MTLSPPVDGLARRLRWPAPHTLIFLGFLTLLLALAGVSLWMRPQHPTGLPSDPALLSAAGLPDPAIGVLTGDLRLAAAALGGEPRAQTNDAARLARIGEAERLLARWARRHPGEPRVRAALGALALARHDYSAAATHYREACERSPHYGEGRLGWGVALALDAERTSEPWPRRALLLRAIAQFAAVDDDEPAFYLPALENRARLLAEVGRGTESVAMARRYLARDGASARAARVRADLLGH